MISAIAGCDEQPVRAISVASSDPETGTLQERLDTAELSNDERRQLAKDLIERLGTPEDPFEWPARQTLAELIDADVLTDEEFIAFVRQLVQVEGRVRDRMHAGGTLPVGIEVTRRRGLPTERVSELWVSAGTNRLYIDDRLVEEGVSGFSSAPIGDGHGHGSSTSSMGMHAFNGLPVGSHRVGFDIEGRIGRQGHDPIVRWTERVERVIEVVPPGEPLRELITTDAAREEVLAALRMRGMRVFWSSGSEDDWLAYTVNFEVAAPCGPAFDYRVEALAPDGRRLSLGRLSSEGDLSEGHGMSFSNMVALDEHEDASLWGTPLPETIDVLLSVNHGLGDTEVSASPMFGEPLLFRVVGVEDVRRPGEAERTGIADPVEPMIAPASLRSP